MAMAKSDAATKADIAMLEAKIDGIRSWITGVAFVTGVAVLLSIASINVSLITALR